MKKSYKSSNSSLGFKANLRSTLGAVAFSTMLFSSAGIFAQTPAQAEKIKSNANLTQLSKLQEENQNKAISQKNAAIEAAKRNGWEVKMTNPDGSFSELQRIVTDNQGVQHPIYYTTYNDDAARSTRTDHLNTGGSLGLNLDGQNMTAYVWDGGHARVSHQEYDGAGGSNRVSVEDASSEGGTQLNFHAAHVTGTITASGVQASAKGMAPQSRVRGYMWNNDAAEATTAASNGMIISNHSYGFRSDLVPDQYFGAYIDESRTWDEIMFNAPNYLMVVAAGNDGNTNFNGQPLDGNSAYDKLTGHSTSKNNLVVANAQDATVAADGTLTSVTINSGSSEGPTDDYRIKPDITGNGTGLYSTYHNSDTAYNSISGTSMASPNVTGSLLLLQQHYNNLNNNFMKAATLKGIALHTADDIGPSGPDAVHGWGLLNAKRAAETITTAGDESRIEELTLTSGNSYTITVDSDGTSPLMASISWTDRPGTATSATNSNTPVLVNDLDIRVTKGSTTYEPYKLTSITTNGTGDNNVDPYERIDVANASGTYTITVTHKGSLTGGSQNFSLIVTGLTGTPVVCSATVPTGVNVSNIGTTSATVNWDEVAAATYDVRYRVSGSSSWTTNAVTGTSTALSGLNDSTTYEVQVRSKCSDGTTSAYSASTTFTTKEPSNGCANGISSFPYSEGFENTIGAWTQSSSDDLNWTVDANGTPSRNTGPSSATEGSYYIFVEASGNGTGYPNKQAIITSPCFDLAGEAQATFSFAYHMYGASDMGSIALEASNDEGATWTSIWSKTGNQGNSWQNQSVDLAAYLGGGVQLRFNRVTGGTWQADIAIDNVSLTAGTTPPTCTDVTLTLNLDNYPEETSWQITDSNNQVVASGGTYGSQPDGSTVTVTECLDPGTYTFTINDSFGDGICCGYGNGSYSLVAGSTTLASGGSFGSSESTTFTIGGSTNSAFLESFATTSQDITRIFPNPLKGNKILNIASSKQNISYIIRDMLGRSIKQGKVDGSNQIKLNSLNSGVYMITLDVGKPLTKRFIVE